MKTIIEKYKNLEGADNYAVGGGLSDGKFASNRHEDAKNDTGKITLGKATQLFKKHSGESIETVKAILINALPRMEWHHAGLLPNGNMKKTYFLKASEMVKIAETWDFLVQAIETANKKEEYRKENNIKKMNFLQAHAVRINRVAEAPPLFHETNREMCGKHGWFDSYGRSYKLTEYLSGWQFESEEKYAEFLNLN